MDQTKSLMERTTERTYKIERKKIFLKTEIREQMRERGLVNVGPGCVIC